MENITITPDDSLPPAPVSSPIDSSFDKSTIVESSPDAPAVEESVPVQKEVRLIDIDVTNENMALNVIVSFLGIAQQRGTFSIAESAKIYECIQKFVPKSEL